MLIGGVKDFLLEQGQTGGDGGCGEETMQIFGTEKGSTNAHLVFTGGHPAANSSQISQKPQLIGPFLSQ